jgi:hypothetical protein
MLSIAYCNYIRFSLNGFLKAEPAVCGKMFVIIVFHNFFFFCFVFEIILAPGLVEKLEAGFRFRPELMDMARETVRKILAKHESKQSESKKKKKTKKDKKKKEYTFVGIQSR